MSAGLHSFLLSVATVSAVAFAGIILARSPGSTPGRLHALYGAAAAWWYAWLAIIATSTDLDQIARDQRIAQLGICMLPGIIYHLNVATAGIAHERPRAIRAHYIASVLLTAYVVLWPPVFDAPHAYAWGSYPGFTVWALPILVAFAVVFYEVLALYRGVARRHRNGSPSYRNARTLFGGNLISMLALVDALPAFGIAVYPIGYAVLTILNVATAIGTIRYRLLEIRPAVAAERILDTISDGFLVVDDQGLIRLANDAAATLIGRPRETLIDRPLGSVGLPDEVIATFGADGNGAVTPRVVTYLAENGRERALVVSGQPLPDEWGSPFARVWILHDATEQRAAEAAHLELESSMRQVQKFETIGVMAGGVAHDFNNILAVIGGNASLALMHTQTGEPVDEEVQAIITATGRAADLTRQMLTYAGRGTSVRDPVDLNTTVREMADLLASAVSKKAAVTLDLDDDLPPIIGDVGQVKQILLNLITNSSEAIGDASGSIAVRSGVVPEDDPIRVRNADGSRLAGPCVFVEVRDDGPGMDQTTASRIFDPFFTTKFTGRGLGLATVMGIVKGHDGAIQVESSPGHGTRVTVALPATPGAVVPAARAADPPTTWQATGRALVADDEAAVRRVAVAFLERAGFTVIEAADGAEAVERFRQAGHHIDVVLLDLTMPRMGGREAYAAIREIAPTVPVVFMSGYAEPIDAQRPDDPAATFLAKPFTFAAMAAKVGAAMLPEGTMGAKGDPPGGPTEIRARG